MFSYKTTGPVYRRERGVVIGRDRVCILLCCQTGLLSDHMRWKYPHSNIVWGRMESHGGFSILPSKISSWYSCNITGFLDTVLPRNVEKFQVGRMSHEPQHWKPNWHGKSERTVATCIESQSTSCGPPIH